MDRKILTLGLCLVIVCIFTLTIAYAALNAVLTISGNAEVVASTWDIYLDNPKVSPGSVTTDVPEIKTNSTLEFSTTLNIPGDFYEFTVDVVNSGSIDAMINNVVKSPELDDNQKKYLNYIVTYQNGESIDNKQTLTHGTTMPIKVRIEYRSDISASDLPTTQTKLDLSLTLEYIQSDGMGSSVKDNGIVMPIADGSIEDVGTIVTIGSEQFYIIGTEGNSFKLLSMYNLYVGRMCATKRAASCVLYGDEASGMQNANMKGFVLNQETRNGTTAFSTVDHQGSNASDYVGSIVEEYVNNYKDLIESYFNIEISEARLITADELTSSTIGCNASNLSCSNAMEWIYSSSYWTGTAYDNSYVWRVYSDGRFKNNDYSDDAAYGFGVRPVIVISKDYF